MNILQESNYEVCYLNDDYLSHEEEVSTDSQSNEEDQLSDLIPLDNLYLEDLKLDDSELEVEDVDCTFDSTQDQNNRPDQNSDAAKDEELEEASPAYSLNDDIWLHIFKFLPGKDILRARQTCLRFNQLITNSTRFTDKIVLQFQATHLAHTATNTLFRLQAKYTNVYIDDNRLINKTMNSTFWPQHAGYIKHLELKNIFITDDFTTLFKYAVNLESLKLINCEFLDLSFEELEDVFYHKLRDFTSIKTRKPKMLHRFIDTHSVDFERLNMQCSRRTQQGYNIELLRIVNNNQARLRHLAISDDGLILKDLTKIRNLKLFSFTHHIRSAFREYTDQDIIKFFRTQNNLRILNFDCINFLPEMSHYLPNLRELNTEIFVKMEDIERPPVNLFQLHSFRYLRKLHLHIHESFDFFPIGRRIFPLYMPNMKEFVLHFARSKARYSSILIKKIPHVMPNLRVLKLINIISDELPNIFKRCTELRELTLVKYEDETTFSVERLIFKHIRKLVHLEKLELFGFTNQMNSNTIRKQFKFPNLKVLKLIEKESLFRFYSEDLEVMFGHCPQIRELYFSKCIIMSYGVIHRSKNLKNLEVLHVEDVYCFNPTSLFYLVKTCKKLKRLYVPKEIIRDYTLRIFMANFLMMMDGFRFYTGSPLTESFVNLGRCTDLYVREFEYDPFRPKSIDFEDLCAPDDEDIFI